MAIALWHLKTGRCSAEVPNMVALRANRWTRYGRDRLYVHDSDGQRVGWVDLQTGVQTLERPDLAQEFSAIVEPHLAASMGGSVATPRQGVTPLKEVPTDESDLELAHAIDEFEEDLAANRPGSGVRAQAESELAGMKSRSRIGTALARAFDVKTDERAWRVGAQGEESVGARLDKLVEHGWHVLHSVPVGTNGSDIDHVVIGLGGVYTVNTKNHPGKKVWVGKHAIKVDGHSQPYLRNSRFEGERASRLLSDAVGFPVFVKPVLVILTGTLVPQVTVKQRPDDVVILDRLDVPRAFRKAPTRLTQQQIDHIYAVARRRQTWAQGSSRSA